MCCATYLRVGDSLACLTWFYAVRIAHVSSALPTHGGIRIPSFRGMTKVQLQSKPRIPRAASFIFKKMERQGDLAVLVPTLTYLRLSTHIRSESTRLSTMHVASGKQKTECPPRITMSPGIRP